MPRVLEIVERKLGDRCCDPSARPSSTLRQAREVSMDFEVFAHPVRLQLLDMLAHNAGRVCVCDLEASVPVKQPTVSHHLRLLREAGLVESERVGQWMYYRVSRDALAALRARVTRTLARLG
jgi:ArsR family transcriptional regulator, arsenate/arsenite/antimonite-responsive transcriptional repressor